MLHLWHTLRWLLLLVALLWCASIVADMIHARASASERADWFKSLKRNGNGASCCDVSDCKRTEAVWQSNGWWAKVNGKLTAIPPSVVLRHPQSLDGEAYVCASPPTASFTNIYCFVPPDMGY